MATSRNDSRFFALPAEIRNQIMEYVLIPGDIYVSPAKRIHHAKKSWKSPFSRSKRFVKSTAALFRQLSGRPQHLITEIRQRTIQQPGLQLMATCKQAYDDGHFMFYAMNTFHWPPGSVNDTYAWYANLRSEHQKMIKSVCIDLNLAEMTYEGMDAVEISARHHLGRKPDDNDANVWSHETKYHLVMRLWTKILGLYCWATPQNLRGFVGLERVIFESAFERCVLHSEPGRDESEWVSLKELVTAMTHRWQITIQIYVYMKGWKETKKWLEGLSGTKTRA